MNQKISSPLALTLVVVLAIALVDVVLLFNDIPDVFISTSYASTTPVYLGKGCTTAYYIDKDCDGYGVGKRADGVYSGGFGDMPDADDNDASVNTPDSVIAKYGTLQNYLSTVKGYNPLRIFYIALDGSNTTAAVNDPAHPYATPGAVTTQLQAGDMILFRAGTYAANYYMTVLNINATSSHPIIVMAYPGERVVIDTFGASLQAVNSSNVIFDGFIVTCSQTIEEGTGIAITQNSHDITVRNIEESRHKWGIGGSDISNVLIENCVLHDSTNEHGIYFSAHNAAVNDNITIRNNLIYHRGRHGIQQNGPATNYLIENNIIHSNNLGGISLVNGVCNSVVRNNIIFNNNKQGVIFYVYQGEEPVGNYPHTETGNLVENNTIWVGKSSWNGSNDKPEGYSPIVFANSASNYPDINLSGNTIRNNILVAYDGPIFTSIKLSDLQNNIIESNIFYKRDTGVWASPERLFASYETDGTHIYYSSSGQIYYWNFSGIMAMNSSIINNTFADPQLTDVLLSYYSDPTKFNFDLLPSSPAINFGTTTGAPTTDLRGYIRDSHPDAGAYEYQGSTPPPPPPVTIYGDVNNDSSVTLSDALLVAQYAVGLTTLNSTQIIKADVSGNNAVTAYDASLILQKILGLISTFPVE